MRLINVEPLIEKIREGDCHNCKKFIKERNDCRINFDRLPLACGTNYIIQMLEDAPTVPPTGDAISCVGCKWYGGGHNVKPCYDCSRSCDDYYEVNND